MIPIEEEIEEAVRDGRMSAADARQWRFYVNLLRGAAGVLLIVMIIALIQIARHGL